MSGKELLPLGAVRTESGDVVVPASRRADGSVRKHIRIRQGYVPQDEVPKYKTVAQRRREQDALEASRQSSDVATVLQSLSLESERKQPAAAPTAPAPAPPAPLVAKSERDNATRKQELGKLNKLLKDIRKFEACDPNELTPAQQRKLERKTALQAERNEILAELNGATVSFTASSSSANPDRAPQTATTTSTNKTKKQFVAIEM